MNPPNCHQYIERETGRTVTEKLFADAIICWLYSDVREKAPLLFNALTCSRVSSLLGLINYGSSLGARISGNHRMLKECRIKFDECLDPPHALNTPGKIFERKIRYWDYRPLPSDALALVSPADSRALVGSLRDTSLLFLKEKFFDFEELFGKDKAQWISAFDGGDYAIFRLTPEKYHYNHCPVSGVVEDFYDLTGAYHSCNPEAVVQLATPYSKNKRTVTVINTNVPGGDRVGKVAMIEIVALMIGDISQCYSEEAYENPQRMRSGLFLKKGQPKSLFRPGSSTVVILFQKERIKFAQEIIFNMHNTNAISRFSLHFEKPIVETDVKVRSFLALPANTTEPSNHDQ